MVPLPQLNKVLTTVRSDSCVAGFGENNRVGEYIALFQDWLEDFKQRDAQLESQWEATL